jgi:hypothetical protein
MTRTFIVSLWLAWMMSSGCAGSAQSRVVYAMNTGALAIEAAQTTAEQLYEAHQSLILEKARKQVPLPTQDVVMARLTPVREKWVPIWDMFAALRDGYTNLVSLMDKKASTDEIALRATELFKKQDAVANKLKELREEYNKEKN